MVRVLRILFHPLHCIQICFWFAPVLPECAASNSCRVVTVLPGCALKIGLFSQSCENSTRGAMTDFYVGRRIIYFRVIKGSLEACLGFGRNEPCQDKYGPESDLTCCFGKAFKAGRDLECGRVCETYLYSLIWKMWERLLVNKNTILIHITESSSTRKQMGRHWLEGRFNPEPKKSGKKETSKYEVDIHNHTT